MGSPIIPIVANLYMEHFEGKSVRSATNPPWVWYRFVDDAWVIQQQANKQAFLEHINSIDPAIKFTVEGTQGNGAIPFLDTLITLLADNSLSITVNHNPTHTDQYLQWNSHHCLSGKYNVISTLTQKAKTVCTDPELHQKELQHLRKALEKCNYPSWDIDRVQNIVLNSNWMDQSNNNQQSTNSNTNNHWEQPNLDMGNNNNQTQANSNRGTSTSTPGPGCKSMVGQVVIPYTKGVAEGFKHICGKYGIKVHFKGNTTVKQVLMKPKDQDPKDKKSGVIYSFQCNNIACDEEYIGETARPLGKDARSTSNNPLPSMHMYSKQDTTLQTKASTSKAGRTRGRPGPSRNPSL